MSEIVLKALLEQLEQRSKKKFDLAHFCFKEQLHFVSDPARFKTAVCSRRSGKTTACAADLIYTALSFPASTCIYITLSRKNAKHIVWPELLRLNSQFELEGHTNETDLSMKFPNGSIIYCSGAKDKSEIENFRGLAIKKVYIDEAQSFRPYIKDLIDDVLSKALFDYQGQLCLIGTPGLVPAGYFYECAKSPEWSHHAWTMISNPHLEKKSGKKPIELIHEDCQRMNVEITHAKIQRECFGKWVVDTDSLVLTFSEKNHLQSLPPKKWSYIFGVDVGFDDADAIAVLAWSEDSDKAYLVEEMVKNKQGITELATTLESLIKKYNPDRIVMDTGGLGKKIASEMRSRFSLPIVAAEKTRKFEFLEILNDALRCERFFASPTSRFAQDCNLLEWDKDSATPDKLKISDRYHSDIIDAVLYAFRESLHWMHEPKMKTPKIETPEWFKEQEEKLIEQLQAKLSPPDEDDIWADLSEF